MGAGYEGAGYEGAVVDADTVVDFVFLADTAEDVDSLGSRRLVNENLCEPSL